MGKGRNGDRICDNPYSDDYGVLNGVERVEL